MFKFKDPKVIGSVVVTVLAALGASTGVEFSEEEANVVTENLVAVVGGLGAVVTLFLAKFAKDRDNKGSSN